MNFYLLEDNPYEAAFFRSCFEERGHRVTHFERPVELFDALHTERPNAVVLDWLMPGVDGFVTLRRVREMCGSGLPVVMLSGLDRADSIVQAYQAGADDYLLKPMTRAVLIARVEALMRRLVPGAVSERPQRLVLSDGPYEIDFNAQTLQLHGRPVSLTPKEFDVAWMLFNNAERLISKAELIACVWGKRAEIASHTVTQHIHTLRTKLQLRENGYRLSAVYGSGYKLSVPVTSSAATAGASRHGPMVAAAASA